MKIVIWMRTRKHDKEEGILNNKIVKVETNKQEFIFRHFCLILPF